ncbi:hypothetical protein [Streptomyces sp. AK04-3B]|uniref:hypothetical protein n=1 Tax=unclassified Streptomyces TaxID=2593676 RepID=UPI0039F4CDB6
MEQRHDTAALRNDDGRLVDEESWGHRRHHGRSGDEGDWAHRRHDGRSGDEGDWGHTVTTTAATFVADPTSPLSP